MFKGSRIRFRAASERDPVDADRDFRRSRDVLLLEGRRIEHDVDVGNLLNVADDLDQRRLLEVQRHLAAQALLDLLLRLGPLFVVRAVVLALATLRQGGPVLGELVGRAVHRRGRRVFHFPQLVEEVVFLANLQVGNSGVFASEAGLDEHRLGHRVFLVELLGLLGDQLGLGPPILLHELVVLIDQVGEFLLDPHVVRLLVLNFRLDPIVPP